MPLSPQIASFNTFLLRCVNKVFSKIVSYVWLPTSPKPIASTHFRTIVCLKTTCNLSFISSNSKLKMIWRTLSFILVGVLLRQNLSVLLNYAIFRSSLSPVPGVMPCCAQTLRIYLCSGLLTTTLIVYVLKATYFMSLFKVVHPQLNR